MTTEAECRLRETAERATPGVWVYHEPKDATSQNPYDREGLLVGPRGLPIPDTCVYEPEDERHIAAACPDNVKVVLTELDRLREACAIFTALVNERGAVVSSADCSDMELVFARKEGRFFVDTNGYGFVLRLKLWREKAELVLKHFILKEK